MSADKETLFRAVRHGEVLLWAGSGFSHYAGYPLAGQLVQRLHESLTPSQQSQLNPQLPLPRYAEHFIELHRGSRHYLTRELQRIFTAAPTSLATHETLARLPFIDHIVTTNYDNLFELAYGARLHKITGDSQLALGEASQVALYKVHGDFSNPNSLVVSDGDFRSFFKKHDRLLWATLESLMARKHVLFVGYSLDDPNVKELFEEIIGLLGPQMRESYLVAPHLSQLAVSWLARHHIRYIDATGEELVEELLAATKSNILLDLSDGRTSADRTSQFLDGLDMDFRFRNNARGLSVDKLHRRTGLTTQTLHFTIEADSSSAKQLETINDLPDLKPIRIADEDLISGQVLVEGIQLPGGIKSLIVVPAPSWTKTVDVFFADGTSFTGVHIAAYGGGKNMYFVAKSAANQVSVKIPHQPGHDYSAGYTFTISVTPRQQRCNSVLAVQEASEIARCLGLGLGFKCLEQGRVVWESDARPENELLENSAWLKQVTADLRLVEQTFFISFSNFELTNAARHELGLLASRLRKESATETFVGFIILTFPDEARDEQAKQLLNNEALDGNLLVNQTETVNYALFGWELQVTARCAEVLHAPLVAPTDDPNRYKLVSQQQQLTVTALEIMETKVLQSPPVQPAKTEIERLLGELDLEETD